MTGFCMRATLALNDLSEMRQNECMTTRWYHREKVKILKCHWSYFLFLQFLYYFYSNDFSNIFHLIDKVCPDQLFFVSGRWVLFKKLLAWASSRPPLMAFTFLIQLFKYNIISNCYIRKSGKVFISLVSKNRLILLIEFV